MIKIILYGVVALAIAIICMIAFIKTLIKKPIGALLTLILGAIIAIVVEKLFLQVTIDSIVDIINNLIEIIKALLGK